MSETPLVADPVPVAIQHRRPLLLSVVCIFSFVFYGLLAVLFGLALINSGLIRTAILEYTPDRYSSAGIVAFMAGGLVLHLAAFTGLIGVWRMRKWGLVVSGGAALLIASLSLVIPDGALWPVVVNILLLLLTGVFVRKYR